jgi:hypothetical protein
VLRLVRRARRSSALAVSGLIPAVSWAVLGLAALTPDQDYLTEAPATRPEPVVGRRRAGRSGTRG